MEQWIVLGYNSDRQVVAFGTPVRGVPFRNEESAQRRVKQLEELHADYQMLAVEVRPSVV